MENNNNQGLTLTDLVFSLYCYRMGRENVINSKILKNIKVKGKNIEHRIDVYVEFVQMNNLERTIIKTIDSKNVKAEDVWQFDNLLKDLGFFPKGILYFNNKIDEDALKIAKKRNIQVIHFDVIEETIRNVSQTLDLILPDRNVIGDPFWVLMKVKNRTKDNTGDYFGLEDSIPLFTSKKLADALCKRNPDFAVFGLSQHHLSILISFVENGFLPELGIVCPSKQTSSTIDYNGAMYKIGCKNLKEIYMR